MTNKESDANAQNKSTTTTTIESAKSATEKGNVLTSNAPRLRLAIGPISPEALAACARVLARFAVEQAQIELGLLDLDKGSDHCSSESNEPSHQQINGPVSVDRTDGAKEQVL